MVTLVVVFWILLFIGIYPYFVYPTLAWAVGHVLDRRVPKRHDHTPTVAVVTAAYNERGAIEGDCPSNKRAGLSAGWLRVIVVSDSSDDGTDEIVSGLCADHKRVRLMRQTPRQGRTAGLSLAIAAADSEIIVFADARSIYRPDTVRKLVRNFADSTVGYVTGKMLYINPDGSLIGDGAVHSCAMVSCGARHESAPLSVSMVASTR